MNIIIAAIFIFIINLQANASTKTNVNIVTNEFDLIENRKVMEEEIKQLRESATQTIGQGAMAELNPARNSEFESIDAYSLERLGREERIKQNYINEFEIDYTKPGAIKHKQDTDAMVTSTEKELRGLTKLLQENGINCEPNDSKTPELKDPYYIQIEKEENKEVDYNQHFCEQPFNNYSCNDAMTITCERKGWSHPWEPEEKKIIFSYQEIKSNGWLYDEHWDTKRRLSKKNYYKQKFGGSHEAVKDEIVKRLNTGKGNIEMIRVNAEGNGELNNLGSRHYSWDSFSAFYRFRHGEETCDKWSDEKWDETCNINAR